MTNITLLDRVQYRSDVVEEKLANVIINKETGCHEYQGYIHPGGYGRFLIYHPDAEVKKKKFYTHRISYAFFKGVNPGKLFVCHKCDNRKCINPDLFLGTHKENMNDMAKKGRVPSRKLNEEKVRTIRKLFTEGEKKSIIAEKYSVAVSTITKIIDFKTWKHVA